MVLLEIIVAGLLLSIATGGSLRSLERERLRGEWSLIALLPLQVAWPRIAEAMDLGHRGSLAVWMLVMTALVAVLLLNAARRRVLGVAALGIALNLLVIGLNGAMPVSLRSVSEIGVPRGDALIAMESDYLHEVLDGETRLAALADVIAVPGPEWHRSVLSLGDATLALGLASWLFVASRSPNHH